MMYVTDSQITLLRSTLYLSIVTYKFCHSNPYCTVEYQCAPSMTWHPALFEQSVVQQLLETQFNAFVERVKTTDCQAELRRLLKAGPPIYVSDAHGMPMVQEGDTHVCNLWYASDNTERSAKLVNAVEGEERQKLWDELKQFIIVEGTEPGDKEEDGEGTSDENNTTAGATT